jgi:hypothetical protein
MEELKHAAWKEERGEPRRGEETGKTEGRGGREGEEV